MFTQGSKSIFIALVFAALSVLVTAECPNACSSHGKCGAFDACQCYRNWMSNDCSERICQFGLAHVDTPKGDLDSSSGVLYSPESTGSNSIIAGSRVAKPLIVGDNMYPRGTYEKYPNMVDSRNNVLSNTAHGYMECSNKGICDRSAGTCTCFDGYDGSACQRASCPSSSAGFCSGHGMCSTVKEIARFDSNNTYALWDEYSTMGCICDPGYDGPDCSEMKCKFGADPLYYDDKQNIRYSNYTFVLWNIDKEAADADLGRDKNSAWKGNFSIVFYDYNGQDWHTSPIDIKATCDDITNALEALPNNVIAAGSVLCSLDTPSFGSYVSDTGLTTGTNTATQPFMNSGVADGFPIALENTYTITAKKYWSLTGYRPFVGTKFTLAFPSNPGDLKQPDIDIYLDGMRPTVTTGASGDSAPVYTWVYPNGFSGENFDFVPDECIDLKVKLTNIVSTGINKLVFSQDSDKILLKKCLGDADGDPSNNNDNKKTDTQDALYNWDYGITIAGPTYDTGAAATYDALLLTNTLLNPHLIKLVDNSKVSLTKLCNTTTGYYNGVSFFCKCCNWLLQ